MESELISALPQLGVAGFAIYILWLTSKRKDADFIEQVNAHHETMEKHSEYIKEVHQGTITQLNHASRVIEDNIKAYERVIKHLDNHIDK